MRASALLTAPVVAVLTVVWTSATVSAAPEFVQRRITLPSGNVALDLGFGLGHDGDRPEGSRTGLGLNLEAAVGLLWNLELGVRTGLRFDHRSTGSIHASEYARVFETEAYGVNADQFANPEVRLTWEVVHSRIAELGLEWRLYLPTED